ncbi:hypothetical protein [Archangium sp.]|uniref:hypothetical protein n=1 Tax=Archangium sp. TaxID=1872627 RepID=UPI002D5447BA|nr:hypothetical protein [Archangium sp.]HYO59979.1 hypothetical protein [Archangium sp.]
METRLRDLRLKLDRALGRKQHPKNIKKMVTNDFNKLSEELLEQVKNMRQGEQLTAVNA